MNTAFETTLTGTEGPIDGIVNQLSADATIFEFKSIDGNVHLVIAKDGKGNWERIKGTEPYLSSWIEELANSTK